MTSARMREFTPRSVDLAELKSASMFSSVTVVVPTYREAENLPLLIDRLADVRAVFDIDLDLIVVDDDSRDGSAELMAARPEPWVQIIVRTTDRGLSQSVLHGLRHGRGEVLVCMDADLSHPPEALPGMLTKLMSGADFVVGSRYADGGSTSDDWGYFRWLNSRVATLLAWPLTTIRDPMAGFFALRRATFEAGTDFSPVGYKIGLELIVRCGCERIVETPIHFEDRRLGQSKLGLKQQWQYLRHLRRLYAFKYGVSSQLTQFLAIGGIGVGVNVAVLSTLLAMAVPMQAAVAVAIVAAMLSNFVLNRYISFSGSRHGSWVRQLTRYVAAASVAGLINYATTLIVMARMPGTRPQLAALVGVIAGTGLNFLASRYFVFRQAHVRLPKA
jgi:dolichol-phosphate mannosyltransferase